MKQDNTLMYKIIKDKIEKALTPTEHQIYMDVFHKLMVQHTKLYRLVNDRVNKSVTDSFEMLTGDKFPNSNGSIMEDDEWDVAAEDLIAEINGDEDNP